MKASVNLAHTFRKIHLAFPLSLYDFYPVHTIVMAPNPLYTQVPSDKSPRTPHETGLWIALGVVAAVVGVSALITVVVITTRRICRRRKYHQVNHVEWPSRDLTGKESMREQPETDHEYQRQYMIRKSLASRKSSPAFSCESSFTSQDAEAKHELDEGSRHDHEQGNLIRDWKEWEATLCRDNSRSIRCHPGIARVLTHSTSQQDSRADPFSRVGSPLPLATIDGREDES